MINPVRMVLDYVFNMLPDAVQQEEVITVGTVATLLGLHLNSEWTAVAVAAVGVVYLAAKTYYRTTVGKSGQPTV